MIGNNSCGPHSVMGGETTDNIVELEVLTYDGTRLTVGATADGTLDAILREGGRRAEIYGRLRALRDAYLDDIRQRFPDIPRRVSGYNLPALLAENDFNVARALVGSEGTCITVLEATVRLLDNPAARTLVVIGYEDVYTAADHVPDVMRYEPIALEGMDDRLVEDMQSVHLHLRDLDLLPEGHGWLIAEFGGKDREESDARARAAMEGLARSKARPTTRLYDDPEKEQKIWRIRESGLGATAHVPQKRITWEGWEDSSVPIDKLGTYLRELRKLFDRYGYACDLYGHFGQGCVHTRIDFDLETAHGIRTFRAFLHDAARLVVGLGGSISGEHGDGQSKAELLPIMFGERLMGAFREFKSTWDPGNRMNPGKIVDAFAPDTNLRLGTAYDPPRLKTIFLFPQDGGDAARAALRCVGVGECRKAHGVMCPSYMATREEKHSTRGRARLLWEALNGNVLAGGWKDEHVKEALDLCLSCKGCKGECPVKVDMATYKAEYLAHYYEGRLRPLNAYAFGYIDRWSRLAAHIPEVANALANSSLAKSILGVHPERNLPRFAREPFTRRFRTRGEGRKVILWPDTFNNYFHPEIAQAAAEVLAAAGCEVHIPERPLCCGRPLYEFGLLGSARAYLARILGTLERDIRDGTPVIGLEPACVSVFREELTNLFAGDEQAHRLASQSFLLSEFLVEGAPRFPFAKVGGQAIVHPHCHHRSVLRLDTLEEVLSRLGIEHRVLDSGCCGMAGSFGFEKEKYDVSLRCANRVLVPEVKRVDGKTLVVADGFSCATQVESLTGRRPSHPAEVLRAAIR
jgi:Fe-S oxidoreductase/FAD/FMN-containing dehydrogenase